MRCHYKNVLRDQDGNVIPSCVVSIFKAGTITPVNVYTTLTGATPVNTITTDANGIIEFYVSKLEYGSSQKFKMTAELDGFTSIDWDYVSIDSVVLGTYSITSDTSVSDHVYIPEGVILKPASGKTLTMALVSAGPYQVFDESAGGSVVVTGYPQDRIWWGEGQNLHMTMAMVAGCSVVAVSTPSENNVIMGNALGQWVVKTLAYIVSLIMPSPGPIGETTPGTVRGLIKHITKTESGSLSEAECSGTCVDNYGQTEAMTQGLPAPDNDGLAFVFDAATAAATCVRFDPDNTEHIFLDGVDLGAGKYVGKDTIDEGDRISLHRVKASGGGYKWQATSIIGVWAGE